MPAKTIRGSIWRTGARTVHKWLALLVGLQVVIWVIGGFVFAMLPFESWVKSGELVRKSAKPTLNETTVPLERIAETFRPLQSLELVGQGSAVYYRATRPDGKKFLVDAATGGRVEPIDEPMVRKMAANLYSGSGSIESIKKIESVERRWGLVDELHGQVPVWRVTYDDPFATRLYFSTESGEFLRARNDTWVFYDFFWRLHIMDYGNGEDFNNVFLRVLAPLALVFVGSGVLLVCFVRFRRGTPRHQP